jgi:hypothetical protein
MTAESSSSAALPETCAVAFKEWEGVVEALATGRQSLILRKGGIEEGPRGFVPEHPAFWLYPTGLHQAEQGLKPEGLALAGTSPRGPEGTIALRALAVVALVARIDRAEVLSRLEPLHVWTDETVEKRFSYRRPGLWVLGVRVFLREEPWHVPITPDHAGCKTWVPLERGLSTAGMAAALSEQDFQERLEQLRMALGVRAQSQVYTE